MLLNRNLGLLAIAQALAVSGSVVIVTVGGIVGSLLTPDPVLATLPLAVMVVGTAAATVFASWLMSQLGRRVGFAVGALIALAGAVIAVLGLRAENFVVFCVGIGLFGVNSAFVQQYRFAATESVAPARAASAVSIVLMGSIVGALIGPSLATLGTTAARSPADYAFPFVVMAGFQLLAAVLLIGYREASAALTSVDSLPARPLRAVVTQPWFVIAVLGGVVGQGVMTYIMTATPMDMHLQHGFSMDDTSQVIRSHVLAMYLPSLIAGPLVAWMGAPRLMALGVVCFIGTLAFGLHGHAFHHYFGSMLLLGVGWNFLYVGGTALLVTTYRASEKYAAQAVNEFSVFGASALASLSAGTVLHVYGWAPLLYSSVPALVAMVLGLLWLWRAELNRSAAVPGAG